MIDPEVNQATDTNTTSFSNLIYTIEATLISIF